MVLNATRVPSGEIEAPKFSLNAYRRVGNEDVSPRSYAIFAGR